MVNNQKGNYIFKISLMSHKNGLMKKFLDVYERRTLLNNILRRKGNWIGHILGRNCLVHDAVEGQMTEVKEYEEEEEHSSLLISSILNNNIS